ILGDPIRRVWVNAKSRTGVTFGDSTFVPPFTLNDEIAERKRFYTTFDEQWCRAQLQRFTLPLNQQIQEFSAGLLAECKTIMAMAHHPEPLILDEPTAGLDVIARNEVL
ncbi:ABC transporter ATP-binding protein, partial [Bifidobacterium animalis]|nr:ABC transporter ATP-binding protein [Bifidobacterium animalis]